MCGGKKFVRMLAGERHRLSRASQLRVEARRKRTNVQVEYRNIESRVFLSHPPLILYCFTCTVYAQHKLLLLPAYLSSTSTQIQTSNAGTSISILVGALLIFSFQNSNLDQSRCLKCPKLRSRGSKTLLSTLSTGFALCFPHNQATYPNFYTDPT